MRAGIPSPIARFIHLLNRISRVGPNVLGKEEVAIFNRFYYEYVLVVGVHRLPSWCVWSKRYKSINDVEKLLAVENDTTS